MLLKRPLLREPEKRPRRCVQLPNHAQSKQVPNVEANWQSSGLGRVLGLQRRAAYLLVSRTLERGHDGFSAAADRRDDLAKLQRNATQRMERK